MKTIKVSEATNLQLDWLVAKCLGLEVESIESRPSENTSVNVWYICSLTGEREHTVVWEPTINATQAYTIIQSEKITINQSRDIMASIWCQDKPLLSDWYMFKQRGLTPLVAAMRCYVVSKMGDVVEVPDEL